MAEPSFTCPNCGAKFNPFAGNEPLSKALKCPRCGHEIAVQQDPNVVSGPVSRPAQTRIIQERLSEGQAGFTFPAGGLTASTILFPIIFIALAAGIGFGACGWLLPSARAGNAASLVVLGIVFCLFVALALGAVYAALDVAFGRSLLYLGPVRIRFHRELFGRRKQNIDLDTTRVRSVDLVEKYVRSTHRPGVGSGEICSIVINSPDGRITFGYPFTQDERRWICYEIREYLKPYAALTAP